MNARDAYKKTIDSDLDRIQSVINQAAADGRHETLYRSENPFKLEVTEALEEAGYVLTRYAPTPMDRTDVYERANSYKYVLGISWYNPE